MTSLWPRLEPLLAKVQKPARYIGCEDGAIDPEPRPGQGRRGCSSTPTPTRSACPTRACRSSTRSSTSAPTPSPSAPTRPGPTSRRCCASHRLPLFSVDTHRPAGEFDMLAFNLSAELVYTNVLNCIDLAGVPVRAADRRPEHPLIGAGGHCTYNPEPLADFVDFVVLGDGEEVVGEITEVVRRVEGERPHRRLARARAARARRRSPASTCRRCTTSTYDGAAPRVGHAPLPGRARARSRSAPSPTWPSGPTRSNQLVPLTEVVHDRLNVEVFRGCTRGCRFCQAGHDHPPGARAPGRAGAHDGRRRPAAHRLRRGRPHVAVDRRLLRHRAGRRPTS